ncbi:MAG: DegT/DnrJ/EryC1/StrS family aminotransferase [Sulfuricurvum sp.]|jgi:perosamine synthetase
MGDNELKYVSDAITSGWISSSGKYVEEFEKKFSDFCGNKYATTTTNGTAALHLALLTIGIKPGDEVIIPTFTMAASAFAICYIGAKPVFVDALSDTWNIDTEKIEEKITEKTKAIMTVSIFGNPSEMDKILDLKKKYSLLLIEDAAEAHGAEYNHKQVTQYADITAYSFFANKHITTGEGGMVTTNSEEYYDRCRYFKNMCFSLDGNRNYLHNDIGFNYRMSNVTAAIGLAQIEKISEYISMRILNANIYAENLKSIPGIILQKSNANVKNVHWMNSVVIDKNLYGHDKDVLRDYLYTKGVDTRLLFNGMHRQPSLKEYGCDCTGSFPISDYLSDNGFYLPSSSSLKAEEIQYICECIKEFSKA